MAVRVNVELDEADVLPERLIAFVLDAFELGERLWIPVGVSRALIDRAGETELYGVAEYTMLCDTSVECVFDTRGDSVPIDVGDTD